MKKTASVASSGTRTVNGNSNQVECKSHRIAFMVNVTAVSGTTPSMACTVQWSNDGTTWFDGDPVDAMTAITTTGAKAKDFVTRGQFARLAWAITGTTPSFTFTVDAWTPPW